MKNNKKHVVFVSQSFYPSPGGVSTFIFNLSKALIKSGFAVTCIHLGDKICNPIHPQINQIVIPISDFPSHELQSYSEFKEFLYKDFHDIEQITKPVEQLSGYDAFIKINNAFTKEILKLDKRNPINTLHIHDYQLIESVQNIDINCKKVLSLHFPLHNNISDKIFEYLLRKISVFNSVLVSTPEYKDIMDIKCPHKNIAICEPLSGEEYLTPNKQIFKIKNMAVCVQRFDAKSLQSDIVNAYVLLKDKDCKLNFVGEGSLTDKISNVRNNYFVKVKNLVEKMNIQNQIKFIGNIDYTKLKQYYEKADCLIILSKMECFGIAVTEAMSQGLPIIASNVGGFKYQIKDGYNGFLVDPNDHILIADKIQTLFSDKTLYKSMSINSRERYETTFSYPIILAKYLKIYE